MLVLLARDVIYTSRAYATMSVSVCLSVTEVHRLIIANLGFKFRSKFTAHWRRGEGSSQQHLALCYPLLGPLVFFTYRLPYKSSTLCCHRMGLDSSAASLPTDNWQTARRLIATSLLPHFCFDALIYTSRAYATMSVSVWLWRKCIGSRCMPGTQRLRQPAKLKPSYDPNKHSRRRCCGCWGEGSSRAMLATARPSCSACRDGSAVYTLKLSRGGSLGHRFTDSLIGNISVKEL